MNLDIFPLTKSHRAHPPFLYGIRIEPDPIVIAPRGQVTLLGNRWLDNVVSFNEVRNWFIQTWGPSIEIHDYKLISHYYDTNPHWSWYYNAKTEERLLYIAGDDEKMLLTLRFK